MSNGNYSSVTSPASEMRGKAIFYDPFRLTDMLWAMRNMGWEVAPKLMERWMSGVPYELTSDEKESKVLNKDLNPSVLCTDIVTMDWAMQQEGVSNAISAVARNWHSPNGIQQLRDRLVGAGWTSQTPRFSFNTTGMSAVQLHDYAQVNYASFGGLLDTINDFYGSIGAGTINMAVSGEIVPYGKSGPTRIIINHLGFYIRDTYDFKEEGINDAVPFKSEFLGIWNKERCLTKTETAEYLSMPPKQLYQSYKGFVPIFNSDFQKWRGKHGRGGDLIVFSDVLWQPYHMSIPV